MKSIRFGPIRLLLFLLLFALPSLAISATLQGRVVGVADGDTVTILTPERQQVKIRLGQIDAPEKAQPFGQRSKQSLSDLIFGKEVRVRVETTDRYGRTVGRIFQDSLDVNLEQVKRGLAWAYRQYLTDKIFLEAEHDAKAAKIGLWSEPNPTPPWEYRHGGRDQGRPLGSAQSLPRTRSGDRPDLGGFPHKEPAGQLLHSDAPVPSAQFKCEAKRYCGQMISCEEARFYLTQCGVRRLDGDGDGIPCESLCGGG